MQQRAGKRKEKRSSATQRYPDLRPKHRQKGGARLHRLVFNALQTPSTELQKAEGRPALGTRPRAGRAGRVGRAGRAEAVLRLQLRREAGGRRCGQVPTLLFPAGECTFRHYSRGSENGQRGLD